MGADDARAQPCTKPPASLPPPPALLAVHGRSRVADLGAGAGGAAFSGPPDTPPRRSPVTVPFLWEDAPGKPKPPRPPTAAAPAAANAGAGRDRRGSGHADGKYQAVPLKLPPRLQQVPPPPTAGTPAAANAGAGCDDRQDSGHADAEYQARSVPLKLPPRLQQVPSFAAAADTPPVSSPRTVLQSPYYGCAGAASRRPPRWARSGRRTPSAGTGLFSRTWTRPKAAHERDAAGPPDAPWCSPASSSSSSSVSTWFGGGDDYGHGGRGRPGDGREVSSSEEEDGSPRGSVRITRFRRNRSLPSMSMATSNLWASIRRSVKQITVWS